MTLVLSVLTQSCVYQVSDRRLIWRNRAGQIADQEDERNKAVLYNRRLVFAYSGQAEVGDERQTDTWLAATLAKWETDHRSPQTGDQRDALLYLAKAANREFERRRLRGRRQAFVAVGWARFADAEAVDDFRPYFAAVSNFMDEEGRLLRHPHEFSLFARVLQPDECGFFVPIGVRLPKAEQDATIRRLAQVDARRLGPEGFMQVLADEVRRVASINERVGRGMLLNVLPRGAIRPVALGGITLAGGPVADQPTFLYVAPDDTQRVQYGPIVVTGGSVMSGFTAGPP
jgi:hypothetical protein